MLRSNSSTRTLLALLLLPALILAALELAPRAWAADFTAANESELAAAITATNAAGAGTHTIALTADIALTGPLPALNNSSGTIAIDGGGHTLSGGGAGRVLLVAHDAAATATDLTITGGDTNGDGGGILVRGRLALTDVTVSGNSAHRGGGIFVDGAPGSTTELSLLRVEISDNAASLDGGGLAANGDEGEVVITIADSRIADNEAANLGGGILASGFSGSVDIGLERTTVSGNSAQHGGGIFMNGNDGRAELVATASTLSGNTANGVGGGLYLNGNDGLAKADVLNSTLSGNEANSAGGIAANDNGGTAELTLRYTTVAANTANSGSAVRLVSGTTASVTASILSSGGGTGKACAILGGAALTSGGYNLDNDDSCGLAAAGDVTNGAPDLAALALNAPGTTATHALGANSDALDAIPAGAAGCGAAVAIDQRGAPRPTPATACDVGAYESDAAEPPTATATATTTATPTATATPSPTATATVSPTPEPSPTPTASATPPSGCVAPYNPATEAALNAAIACVNAAGAGSHLITLAADLALTGATTPLNNPAATELRLAGAGHTIDGHGHGPILSVAAGTTAHLSGLTLQAGAAADGAAVNNAGVLTIESSQLRDNAATGRGGAVFNSGRLTLKSATLTGNSAPTGGGVASAAEAGDAAVTILDSNLTGNTAGNGGGLWAQGAGHVAAVTLRNTTFADNTGTTGAGGAALLARTDGRLTATIGAARFNGNSGGGLLAEALGGDAAINVDGTTFAGNTAADGAGVLLRVGDSGTGELLLSKTTLSGNAATGAGGGVYATATGGGTAHLTLFNATLSGNSAGGAGGGLSLATSGGATGANLVYTTLAGNTANGGGGGIHTAGSASATLTATIITNGAGAGPDCVRAGGSIISTGYNLDGDNSCLLPPYGQGNDLPGTAAGLLPLAVYAPGSTATHALSAVSPAADRIPIGAAGCGTAVTTDQRGAPRPEAAGGRCDLGAYERGVGDGAARRVFAPVVLR